MIQFGGLSSGLDTAAIVKALVSANRTPISRLEDRKGAVEMQISKIGDLTSKLNALKSAAEDISEAGSVLSLSGTTSDEDVLGIKASTGASAANYDVTVSQLAQTEKDRSAAFGSAFSEVKAGTLTLEVPGADPVDITIDEGDTLQDLVGKINGAGAGVDASLIDDGTSTYLQLVAEESGHEIGGAASDAIKITETYSGASGAELALTEIQTAANAQLTVDGLAVEHRSNIVDGVVDGVTFELESTGSASASISVDLEGTKEALTAFVDAYNEVASMVDSELTVTEATKRERTLGALPGVRRLESELRTLSSAPLPGLDSTLDSLAELGIERSSSKGTLSIDSDALDEALQGDLSAVDALFADAEDGLAAKLVDLAERFTDSTDGSLSLTKKSLESRVDGFDEHIERLEVRSDAMKNRLERQFAMLETTMAQIQLQGSSLTAMLVG